jgi:hypothetical protein
MEYATSYLTVLPSKEEEINSYIEKVCSEVESGLYDPLKIWVQLNAIKKVIAGVEDRIKESAINERLKYGAEKEIFGVKISVIEAGVKYDYSACNDSTLDMIEQKKKFYENEIKERQKFLKSIPKDKEFVDPETGEVLCAPSKSSTTTLKIEKL